MGYNKFMEYIDISAIFPSIIPVYGEGPLAAESTLEPPNAEKDGFSPFFFRNLFYSQDLRQERFLRLMREESDAEPIKVSRTPFALFASGVPDLSIALDPVFLDGFFESENPPYRTRPYKLETLASIPKMLADPSAVIRKDDGYTVVFETCHTKKHDAGAFFVHLRTGTGKDGKTVHFIDDFHRIRRPWRLIDRLYSEGRVLYAGEKGEYCRRKAALLPYSPETKVSLLKRCRSHKKPVLLATKEENDLWWPLSWLGYTVFELDEDNAVSEALGFVRNSRTEAIAVAEGRAYEELAATADSRIILMRLGDIFPY